MVETKAKPQQGGLTQAVPLVFQVIIKKFQIPCPLPMDDAVNETVVMILNTTLGQLDSKAVAYSDDACTPKYFVFNSQVRERSLRLEGDVF